MDERFRIIPGNPPNEGILFVNHALEGHTGHMGHALVEYAPGCILAFYPNCLAEDPRWKGHSGYGWMEYKRSTDGGLTWSEPIIEPHSKALFDKQTGRTHACEKAVCTPSGRIVLFYLTCDMTVNGHIWEPYYEPYYAWSDDGGLTWSEQRMFCRNAGRIYDAAVHDGKIYVLLFANPEEPNYAHITEFPMLLYVSEDNGESFHLLSQVGFQSMLHCFYGNMLFTPDGRLLIYTYEEKDEHNLKYIISRDGGRTWENNRRAFFRNRLRNPQLNYYKGKYFIHGRSGSMGKNPGNFILYTSDDGVNWDDGQILLERKAGWGAYSNNLIVHMPDGGEKMLIQASHAYEDNKTNIIHFWVEG